MCNRWVWLFTVLFWVAVYAFAGWKGIGFIIALSGACMLVVGLVERRDHG